MRSRSTFAAPARVGVVGGIVGALVLGALTPVGALVARTNGQVSATPHLVFATSPGTTVAGTAFSVQPKVEIEDASGALVTDKTAITLTLNAPTTGGPGSLKTCSQSETKGVVAFTGCKIDARGTGYSITASLKTYTSASSSQFTVVAGAPTKVVFTTEPSTITAGHAFSPAPTLTVEDRLGNAVGTAGIKLAITAVQKAATDQGPLSCSGNETHPSSTAKTPKAATAAVFGLAATNGAATFSTCTIDKSSPGTYSLIGIAWYGATGKTKLSVTSTPFSVRTGPASRLVFTTSPNAAEVHQAFGLQPAVSVEDAAGNVATGATGTVSLAITSATGTPGAALTGCTAGTLTSGTTAFAGCSIDEVGTGYRLQASLTLSGTPLTGKSQSFAVSSGPASAVTFTRTPGNGTGGSPLSLQPAVSITDTSGTAASGVVQLTLLTATGAGVTGSGVLSCSPNPVTAATGVVTFKNCAVDKAGTYRLRATDLAATGVTAESGQFTITTGPAAKVVFTASPSSSTGGSAFATQPAVSVEDLGGNLVPTSTVTLALTPGTGAPGATLVCTGDALDQVATTTGAAAFSGCSIDKVGSGYVLTASSAGARGTSTPFDVALGPPSRLVFSAEPSGGTVSTPLGGQPQVSVTDAGGNPEADGNVPVTLASSSGTLSCLSDPVTTDATGVAVFSGCRVGGATGTLHLLAAATASGLASATSTAFGVASGTPLGVAPQGVPVPAAQTYGKSTLGIDPTSVVDDVNSATGALDVSYPDLKMAAVGEPFTLTRQYNSNDTSGGSFGPGWSSILEAGVEVAPGGRSAVVRGPSGQQLVYTSDGKGGWTPPAGAQATLGCDGALCTVTEQHGTVFQSIDGQIQDYLSPDGIGLHFVYSHGHLVQITGAARTLVQGVETSLGQQLGSQGWSSASAGHTDLADVAALDTTHLWAVGADCTVEFSANGGSTWSSDPNVSGCAPGTSLTSVTADGPEGPAFAVGTGGTVLVCAAACYSPSAAWYRPTRPATPPADVNFASVWSPSANLVYAVGTTTTGAGQVWSCSATCAPPRTSPVARWVDITPPGLTSTALHGVSGEGTGFVVAVGTGGKILVCATTSCASAPSAWRSVTQVRGGSVPAPSVDFSGVWAGDPNHVYAVGASPGGGGAAGVVWACSRGCGAQLAGPASGPAGTAAWADVTPQTLGSTTLSAVAGSGSDAVWALGSDGEIWFCSANCATEEAEWVSLGAPGGSVPLAGMSALDARNAWVVGAGGAVERATGPSTATIAMDGAIGALGAALTASLWTGGATDGNDLSATGAKVFADARQAVGDLWTLASPSFASVPSWGASALLDVGQALRIVDANALSKNLTSPKDPSALSSAETAYAAGDTGFAAGSDPSGAADYESAWIGAFHAGGSGQGSDEPLQIWVQENAAGEVTALGTPTRTVHYAYTGDLLTGYTDAAGGVWTYSYTSQGAPKLSGVTAPTGAAQLTVGYAQDRVERAVAAGNQTAFSDSYTWTATHQVSTRAAFVQLSAGAGVSTADFVDQYAGNVLLSEQLPDGATSSYRYDANLDLTGMQDPLGEVQTMTYDASGDLLSQSSPAYGGKTATVSFTFNAEHLPLTQTDANGHTTTYAYTGENLVKTTPPALPTGGTGATSDKVNYLGEEYAQDGPTADETFTYDAAGNQTGYQLRSPGGQPLDGLGPVFSYTETGQKTVSTDPRGHGAGGLVAAYQTVDSYNALGELLSTTSPGGLVTSTAYTPAGDVASVTEPTGHTTSYSWNASSLQLTSSGPSGPTVARYDPSGNLLESTSGGATTSYTYGPTGEQTSVTAPSGVTTSTVYNLAGNALTTSTSAGSSSSFTYDAADQLVHATVDGVTTSTTYDLAGNVASRTDADGRTTTFTYNSHELLASVTTPAGTTTYGYDLAGNLVAVTDALGNATRYTVNGAGERTAMTVGGHTTTYGYDVAGNLVSTTDPDGRTTTYTVNAQDLRTAIDYSQTGQPTISVHQTFNAAGERTAVTEQVGGAGGYSYTTTFAYNASGQLTSASSTTGGTYTYTYKTAGKMVETYPDGSVVTYTYDDAHNLMGVSTSTGISASYVRNAKRQVAGIAYSNGVFQALHYDAAGFVTSMSLSCAATTELVRQTSLDAGGAPLAEATTVGMTTTVQSYGYDPSGRTSAQLTSTAPATTTLADNGCTSGTASATPPGNDGSGTVGAPTPPVAGQPSPSVPKETPPGTGTTSHPIAYDAVGDITSIGGTTISYKPTNEVTSASNGSSTYDNAGNLTSETVNGKSTTFTYNAADQLVGVTRTHGATTVSYTYDGSGNRATRTVDGSTTYYSWDQSTTVALLGMTCSAACAGGNVLDKFVYGVGPVAMRSQTGTFYLHEDQQGNVVALTNDKGKVVETFTYDAFGKALPTTYGTSVPAEPLLFQSQYLDTATGLYDMHARNYDPASGTFTQRDPVAPAVGTPAISPYAYANDQPTAMSDPTGDSAASSAVNSWYYGHSTRTTDIVGASYTSAGATSGGLKVVRLLAAFPEDSMAFESLQWGGRVFAVAAFALGTYVTVEDCEHGPVAKCVGDSVGLALALACTALTQGWGGLACGMASAAIGMLISRYGPQIVQGLADLGQYEIEGITYAIYYVTEGFQSAGYALTGAYGTVATESTAEFNAAEAGVISGYIALNGLVASGFDQLASYVSSGLAYALSTLEGAGETAVEMADVLKNDFNEGIDATVNELISLGYDVDGVANALAGAFGQGADQVAALLSQVGYTLTDITSGLRNGLDATAAAAARALAFIGTGIDQIATMLKSVYGTAVGDISAIFKGLQYTAGEIAGMLTSVYDQAAKTVAQLLSDVGYSVDVVANALRTVFTTITTPTKLAAAVAGVLQSIGITPTSIAGALRTAFQTSAQELTTIFKTDLGETADAVASALESAYGETVTQITTLLKQASYGISQIEGALTSVFHMTTSAIESTLSNFFTNTVIDSIGGAFSSFGQTISTWVTTVGTWLTTVFG